MARSSLQCLDWRELAVPRFYGGFTLTGNEAIGICSDWDMMTSLQKTQQSRSHLAMLRISGFQSSKNNHWQPAMNLQDISMTIMHMLKIEWPRRGRKRGNTICEIYNLSDTYSTIYTSFLSCFYLSNSMKRQLLSIKVLRFRMDWMPWLAEIIKGKEIIKVEHPTASRKPLARKPDIDTSGF